MAAIPIRLPPLPGEALDSWLETYAHLLHVAVRDIVALAGADWDRLASDGERQHKLWLYQLDEPDLAALSTVTGVPAATLADMTLARYEGTGLAAVTGLPRTPRWWRQPIGSRYCPRCLAANGGRWMLTWRIPWTFACTGCRVLLAGTCPDCGRRHRRTRTGQPRRPGRCDLTGPAHGRRRQVAPVAAFGITIADVMLHGRRGDPDPLIAAWLADNEAGRKKTAGPAGMLARWNQASPALQAALAKPLASRLDTFCQLRYRARAGPARIPDPARAGEHARALPSLLWPGWALRLMPPEGLDFLRYRSGLGVMLAVASAGADGYRTAQELLGLQPVHGNRFASFTARLRKHQVLEPVAAAICQLARKLDQHGATPRPRLRRVRLHPARADGRLPAPAGQLPAPPRRHQRTRHLGTAV